MKRQFSNRLVWQFEPRSAGYTGSTTPAEKNSWSEVVRTQRHSVKFNLGDCKMPTRKIGTAQEPDPKTELREVTVPRLIEKANATFDNLLLAKLIVDILDLADELDRSGVLWVSFRHRSYGNVYHDFSPWEMVVKARKEIGKKVADVEEVARIRGAMMVSRDSTEGVGNTQAGDNKGLMYGLKRRLGFRTG